MARPASANLSIEQRLVEVASSRGKKDALIELLRADDMSTAIVFSNRKTMVRELAQTLSRAGFKAGQIQGDMDQSDRIRELDRFKNGDITILVASDVAARGLDVKGVSHVFNFDVPWHPDDYVHRIGRTGRAGATGKAFTLVTPEDAEAISNIEKTDLDDHPARRQAGAGRAEGRDIRGWCAGGRSAASARRWPGACGVPTAACADARDRPPKPQHLHPPPPCPPNRWPRRRQDRAVPRRARRHLRKTRPAGDADGEWNGPVPSFSEFRLRLTRSSRQ